MVPSQPQPPAISTGTLSTGRGHAPQGRFEAASSLPLPRSTHTLAPAGKCRPHDLALFRIGEFERPETAGPSRRMPWPGSNPTSSHKHCAPHLVYWGRACYIANQTAAAQGIFRRLLEDPSAESTPAMQEQALYFLGRIALEQKRWDEALDLYQQLAALPEADPNLRIEAALQQVNLRYRTAVREGRRRSRCLPARISQALPRCRRC